MSKIMQFLLRIVLQIIKKAPYVKDKIRRGYKKIMAELEPRVKPYTGKLPVFCKLPESGLERDEVLKEMEDLRVIEEGHWKDGFVSGAVYHGDKEHIEFLNRVYAIHSQSNPLHADVWPSAVKFEAEVVAMAANMLGASKVKSQGDEVCGTMASGGTESILLAMKTYRDFGRAHLGITKPQVVIPITAHAAFDKAAQYFHIDLVKIPVDADYRADIAKAKKAIGKNTIAIVGSAPSFPHGIIDPIAELSELALKHGIGFHTDACLGGFVLPWARKLGYRVCQFDFELPGVTSISVDTHKYGYAPKGSSVILYRNLQLRHHQFFKIASWPGGLYFSPSFAGSRPGALLAACWAALMSIGENGYLKATEAILKTAEAIKREIRDIPELHIVGDPLWVIAFTSTLNIYQIMDFMAEKKWHLNALHHPPALHICVTLRHCQAGVVEKFSSDLRAAVAYVKQNPVPQGGMAPVYGMAAKMSDSGIVEDLLDEYLDLLYFPGNSPEQCGK